MTKRFLSILLIGMITCWQVPAWALLMPQMTMEDLVGQAHTIVSGKCLSLHFHPTSDGKTLHAIIQFEVQEYFKNDLGKGELTLLQVARQETLEGVQVPGSVSFEVDEEAVLFLTEEDQEGFRHVVGLQQGKFEIQQGQRGARTLVRDFEGVQFFNRKTGDLLKVKRSHEEKDLDSFREELKRIASQIELKKQELILVRPNRSP